MWDVRGTINTDVPAGGAQGCRRGRPLIPSGWCVRGSQSLGQNSMVVQRIGEDDGEFTGRVEVWKAARWPLQFLKHKNYWRGCYSWIIHGGANAPRWSFLVHKKCRWQQSERCPSCKTWILDWSTVILVVNAPIFFEYYLMMMMSSLLESNQEVVILFAGFSLPFKLLIQHTYSFWKKGSQFKSICDRCNDPEEAYRGMKDI